MKILKYWKQCLKLKSVKSDYQKGKIEQCTRIEPPVQTKADSESTNPDPIQNNHTNNYKIKTNIKLNQRNMI